ncbi:MAG: ABC transporter ATP-binding protein/permease [Treponema sp.]|nr:ABC transporter ATP-binding protein/permease [Treponema sp.]
MFETLRKFFNFCDRENRNKFYASMLVGLFNSFFMALRIAAIAVMMQGIIKSLIRGEAFLTKTIWLSFGIMAVSLIFAIITKKIITMWQCEGGYRTCANKRIEIARHLRYLPMGYFNKNSLGEITSVTTNTMELVGDIATRAVMLVTQGLLDSALIILMLFFFDWRIGLISLGGFLLFQFINIFMRLSVKNLSYKKTEDDTVQVGKILEYIQGIAEVKAYNLFGKRRQELNSVIDSCKNNYIKLEMACIPFSTIQSLVSKLTGVAIMLASIYFCLNGTMLIENCVVMLICSFMLFTAMEAGGNYSALLRMIDIGVSKAQAILDVKPMDIDGKSAWENEGKKPGKGLEITARNIAFCYDKKKIIDNVSLTIPEKSTTAIVGPSGSGKTTLCHLLARFWDVNQGEICLGGVNVKDYSMDDLMKNFSFVFQNVYLFHDSIANNIRFGNEDTPMEKVIEAAKKACCHDFISSLPQGYDTVIGEGGASLSGGEKQRISIARAILKDAPIIILDEATANVDPENEGALMEAVKELTKEKTVIMIAHRLKTVRHADKILVLDQGRIVEEGKHEDLIKIKGIYKRFIDSREKATGWKL